MKFVFNPISESKIKAATRSTKQDYASMLKEISSLGLEIATPNLYPEMLDIIRSRAPRAEGGQAYPLFAVGENPYAFIAKCLGDPESWSALSQEVDANLVRKVGPQGYSFPVTYLWKQSLKKYYDIKGNPKIKVPQAILDAMVKAVANELRKNIGELTPLTWDESIDVVCAKPTQCYPFGKDKDHPEVKDYLRRHPGELGGSALIGQRFQRNKADDQGNPIPRCTFNSDVRDVVQATRFSYPLIKAIQEWAKRDPRCPYTELNGPEAVGNAAYRVGQEKPNVAPTGIGCDVTGMDTCMTLDHAELFIRVLNELYSEEYHDEIAQSVKTCFTCDLVLDDGTVIKGVHALFSGTVWTHILEDIISRMIGGFITLTIAYQTNSGTGKLNRYDINSKKPPLVLVCGDDMVIIIYIPVEAELIADKGNGVGHMPCDIKEHVAWCYDQWGCRARADKQTRFYNAFEFCSKLYRAKAVAIGETPEESFYRPIYSPILALNAIFFPEETMDNPSLSKEVMRVAQICDEMYGSEHYGRVCTQLYTTIPEEIKAKFAAALAVGNSIRDEIALSGAVTWNTYMHSWESEKSPTIRLWEKFSGLQTPEIQSFRAIVMDAHRMRALHWRYHIDPRDVLHPAQELAGNDSRDRYASIFTDEFVFADELNPAWFFAQGLNHGYDGEECTPREASQYSPVDKWEDNMRCDTPLSTYHPKGIKDSSSGAKNDKQLSSIFTLFTDLK